MISLLSRFIKFIIILLVIMGLFFILLPTLASSSWGNKQLTSWINHRIPGKVEIKSLSLNWTKGQLIEGFLLKDPEGKTVVEWDKFSTEASLWQLMRKDVKLGLTQLQDLNALIITDDKGVSNLQKTLGVSLDQNDLLKQSTLILSHTDLNLNLFAHQRPLSIWAKGFTEQDNLKGSFDIQFSLDGLKISNWEELSQEVQDHLTIENSKEAQIYANIVNFPVDLIDCLVDLYYPELNGFFHALLGDRLNMNLKKEDNSSHLSFQLAAFSSHMQGHVKGQLSPQILIIDEGANFSFNVQPEIANFLMQDNGVKFLKPFNCQLLLSRLSLPFSFFTQSEPIDLCQLGGQAVLNIDETEIENILVGRLAIQQLQIQLDAPLCEKEIECKITGRAQQGKNPIQIELNTHLDKPNRFSSLTEQLVSHLKGHVKIVHFPLQLIPFFQQNPEWIENIGGYADIEGDLLAQNSSIEAFISAQTDRLNLKQAHFQIGQTIHLVSPTEIEWRMERNFFQHLFKSDDLELAHACPLKLHLQQLQFSLDQPQLAKFDVELLVSPFEFSNLIPDEKLQVKNLSFKAVKTKIEDVKTELKGQLSLLDADNKNSPLTPEPLVFNQISHWKIKPSGMIEMPQGKIQLDNTLTHFTMAGTLNNQREIELTQPAHFHHIFTPEAVEFLSHLWDKKWPTLLENSAIDLTIDPLSFNLNSLQLSAKQIRGLLSVDQIMLQDATGALPRIEKVDLPWTFNSLTNTLAAHLKGLVYIQKNVPSSPMTGEIKLELDRDHLDLAHTKADVQFKAIGLPTSLINLLSATHDLSPLIGPSMDIDMKTLFDPCQDKMGYCDLALDSAQLHLNGRFRFNEAATLFDASKPPVIQLTVTPSSYAYLKKLFEVENDDSLASPFIISGTLSKFYLPIKNFQTSKGEVDFKLASTPIQWKKAHLPPVELKGEMVSENLSENLSLSFQLYSSVPLLTFEGSLYNLFHPEKGLQPLQEMGLSGDLKGENLTPFVLQNLFFLGKKQTQKVQALFGENIQLDLHCQLKNLQGSFQAAAKGTQGEIHLDAKIADRSLTLNKPLEGFVKMTPLFTQAFFTENMPVLSTAVGSDEPIKFKIDSADFRCPLFPFKLEEIKIGKGMLDLGRIRFKNEGALSYVLNFIRPLTEPYFNMWFTPLYFQLDRGILSLKRVDLLVANTYTLASWGRVDLNQHQADLIIGLGAQTLQYAFGIQGLDDQYFLQIPLHSLNGEVEIDKKKATTRISALLAQTKAGSKGKLIGNLINLAFSSSDKEGGQDEVAAPAPTTQPFPWQNDTSYPLTPSVESIPADPSNETKVENGSKHKKKNKHKKSDSPEKLNDWQEGASELFNQLFK